MNRVIAKINHLENKINLLYRTFEEDQILKAQILKAHEVYKEMMSRSSITKFKDGVYNLMNKVTGDAAIKIFVPKRWQGGADDDWEEYVRAPIANIFKEFGRGLDGGIEHLSNEVGARYKESLPKILKGFKILTSKPKESKTQTKSSTNSDPRPTNEQSENMINSLTSKIQKMSEDPISYIIIGIMVILFVLFFSEKSMFQKIYQSLRDIAKQIYTGCIESFKTGALKGIASVIVAPFKAVFEIIGNVLGEVGNIMIAVGLASIIYGAYKMYTKTKQS